MLLLASGSPKILYDCQKFFRYGVRLLFFYNYLSPEVILEITASPFIVECRYLYMYKYRAFRISVLYNRVFSPIGERDDNLSLMKKHCFFTVMVTLQNNDIIIFLKILQDYMEHLSDIYLQK